VGDASAQSDNELVAQSLHGDTNAFGTLVLRHRQMVLGIAYRVCGDAALADDIAQETFIRAWDRLHTYRPEGNLRGWLCRIASNLTIDALRRHKPTVNIEAVTYDGGALAASNGRPEAAALQSERATAVRGAIMNLPVQTRMALVLREYQGLSYQEIADHLDIPLGTVKSRLNDARRRLKAALAAYVEE
jgi:RNA polymerase sigma-70 factor (ECF subfamily)